MAFPARISSISLALLAIASTAVQAAPIIGWFAPEYPALFAPSSAVGEPVRMRAFTDWGAPVVAGTEARIDVTCGEFLDGSTSMHVAADDRGWMSDAWAWRSPSQEQDCSMVFTEVGGDGTTFTLPVHVYDPATVTMLTNFGDSLTTEAARPFEMTLAFYTAAGLPIINNMVVPMASKTQGASAELYLDLPATNASGIMYVGGVANNAVGEYEIIVDLEGRARWYIPVYQGVPLPGSRRHWGSM